MIKVILVDDEYLVRVRLRSCVNWNELGFEIAGEAENGEDALSLVESVRPRLAIVDIYMPFGNGLDFAKVARERYPELKVVILTGYSSFEYARSALQAGVVNYLLKPVIKDELQKILVEIKEQIAQESQLRETIENLKVNSKERITLLKQRYIQSLLEGAVQDFSGEEDEKFRLFCPGLENSGLAVAVISIDGLNSGSIYEKDRELWRFAVSNVFGEIFENAGCFEISYDTNGQIILIVNAVNTRKGNSSTDYISLCETAKSLIKEYLKFTVTIGVGKIHEGIAEICLSYKEAQTALKNKLIFGNDRIIEFNSIESKRGVISDDTNFRQNMLINLRLGNTETVLKELHRMFASIVEKGLLIENLYIVLSELQLTITNFVKENEINMWEITDEDMDIQGMLNTAESIGEIENSFKEILNSIARVYSNRKYMGYTRIVDKVKAYIDKNYSNTNLSLENIASNMSINASHLSNIFKKESGLSITEYLTECRMRNAKELIDKGNKKLYEIAELVGFNDPYYFSKCFKKTFGVSASKYFKNK